MPRSSTLRPAFREERANKGLSPWCLNVPEELSDTGKRRQMFFPTKAAAAMECEKLKARKDNFGLSLTAITPAKIAEANEAYKLLAPYDVSLLDAVRAHVALLKARTASITFGEAFDRFAEIKRAKSPKYREEIRLAKSTFESLHDHMISDIKPADLEPILDGLPAAARNAKMRRLRSVFNVAVKRGWMGGAPSPIPALDFADGNREEVEVFGVDAVRALLEHALENDLEFLPYRVLTFFCGIRPEGELERL